MACSASTADGDLISTRGSQARVFGSGFAGLGFTRLSSNRGQVSEGPFPGEQTWRCCRHSSGSGSGESEAGTKNAADSLPSATAQWSHFMLSIRARERHSFCAMKTFRFSHSLVALILWVVAVVSQAAERT